MIVDSIKRPKYKKVIITLDLYRATCSRFYSLLAFSGDQDMMQLMLCLRGRGAGYERRKGKTGNLPSVACNGCSLVEASRCLEKACSHLLHFGSLAVPITISKLPPRQIISHAALNSTPYNQFIIFCQ
jgi:hypothetical protein